MWHKFFSLHLLFFFVPMTNDYIAISQFIKIVSSQKKNSVHKFKNIRRVNSRRDKDSEASKTRKFIVTMTFIKQSIPITCYFV